MRINLLHESIRLCMLLSVAFPGERAFAGLPPGEPWRQVGGQLLLPAGHPVSLAGAPVLLSGRALSAPGYRLPAGDYRQLSVSGRISNEQDEPLPGVSVVVKGTSRGTVSDVEGNYLLEDLDAGAVLLFSFLGYQNREVPVEGRTVLNVRLEPDQEQLSEVVVTALGISREKRSLGYSIEEVGGEELTKVAHENVLNAMSGKVAGVTISSTGSTGSSVSMIIRGATSLSSDNQPLFVIDGVPIANTVNNVTEIGDRNVVDYGNAISSLNPEDIESVSVLKGPSAAALYGSRAGNGVVLITTRSGRGAERLTVSVTSNTVFDLPYRYLDFQSKFGSGQFSAIPVEISGNPLTNPFGSLIQENIPASLGAELDKGYEEVQWNSPLDENGDPIPMPLVSHPDNVRNFVQTGITSTNSISVSNNAERINYRISYSNMVNRGIIPNSDLSRNTLNINAGLQLNKSLRVSSNIDFSRNGSDNRPAGERGTNPLQWAYNTSPHVDLREMRDYWMPGQEGLQQRSQYAGEFNNPYFLAYEVNNSFRRDRVYGNIRADWQITPGLSLMLRYGLDTYKENRESKVPYSYTREPQGAYGIFSLDRFESNADFLATYDKTLNDFTLSVSAGGNIRYQRNTDVMNASKTSTGLVVPGVYTIQNILPDNLNYYNYLMRRGVNSVYGLASLGYKQLAYLSLTARNDWSSTLPGANPYFYPSASLSLILNEIAGLQAPGIDLIKLRAGFAQVGNDADAYQLSPALSNAGTWDGIPRLDLPTTLLTTNLKPEESTSYEAGTDISLFGQRLRFSGTWYVMENRNQIFNTLIPPSSGASTKNINAGLLKSRGVELSLGGTPVQGKEWRWDLDVNFTRNRTTIEELSDQLPYYTFWTDAQGGAWTYVGDEIGDIYDAQVVTVEDVNSPYYGYPILDNTGKWQSVDAINTKNKIGNFNPDFILGGQTALSFRNWSLQLTFDWRKGGDFVSQTYRYGEEDGRSQLFFDKLIDPGDRSGAELKEYLVANEDRLIRINGNYFPLVGGPTPEYNSYPFTYGPYTLPYGGVFIPGVRAAGYDSEGNPTGYIENLGENIGEPDGTMTLPYAGSTAWSFTRAFLFPADYLKIREITLTYHLPLKLVSRMKLQRASVSVYSRNIMLWTAAKIGIDPENAFQPSGSVQGSGMQFKQGIERYNVTPWVMPVGLKLHVTF